MMLLSITRNDYVAYVVISAIVVVATVVAVVVAVIVNSIQFNLFSDPK